MSESAVNAPDGARAIGRRRPHGRVRTPMPGSSSGPATRDPRTTAGVSSSSLSAACRRRGTRCRSAAGRGTVSAHTGRPPTAARRASSRESGGYPPQSSWQRPAGPPRIGAGWRGSSTLARGSAFAIHRGPPVFPTSDRRGTCLRGSCDPVVRTGMRSSTCLQVGHRESPPVGRPSTTRETVLLRPWVRDGDGREKVAHSTTGSGRPISRSKVRPAGTSASQD